MHQKQPPANVALANPWLAIGIESLKADWNMLDNVKLLIKSSHRKLNGYIIISLANAGLKGIGVTIKNSIEKSMKNGKRGMKKGMVVTPSPFDLRLLTVAVAPYS